MFYGVGACFALACCVYTASAAVPAELLPDLELDVQALINTLTVTTDDVNNGLQCALEEGCFHPGANWSSTVRLLRFDTNTANIGTADFFPPDAHDAVWHQCHSHFHGFQKYANYYISKVGSDEVLVTGHKASFCLMDSGCNEGFTPKYGNCNIDQQGISVGCWDAYTADLECQWVDISELPSGTYDLRVTVNEDKSQPELRYDNNAGVVRFTYDAEAYGDPLSAKAIISGGRVLQSAVGRQISVGGDEVQEEEEDVVGDEFTGGEEEEEDTVVGDEMAVDEEVNADVEEELAGGEEVEEETLVGDELDVQEEDMDEAEGGDMAVEYDEEDQEQGSEGEEFEFEYNDEL